MTGRAGGQFVVAVLSEAVRHFGRITPDNQHQVARWVQNRLREIEETAAGVTPYQPRTFDAKARQAGE